VRVVETNTVPKMKSNNGIWVPIEGEGAGKEPIGVRIMETPENAEQTECFGIRAWERSLRPDGVDQEG